MGAIILAFVFAAALASPVAGYTAESGSAAARNATASSSFDSEVGENIRCHIEQLQQDIALQVGSEKVAFNELLSIFYQERQFAPVWTKRKQINELIRAIEGAEADGLNPEDYHLAEIKRFTSDPPSTPFLQARYDLLLSDALFKLSWHLMNGKVDPEKLDSNWNISNGFNGDGLLWRLQNAIEGDSIAAALEQIRPVHPKYLSLKKALARYRDYESDGGWPSIPAGPSIRHEGDRDERIPVLRRRLEITGEAVSLATVDTSFADSAMVYSKELVDAVMVFQRRNGLEVDGVVGPRTLEALNISASQRVEQIRINLERYRWFITKLEPTFIMVNIAGFTIQYVENGALTWSSRVIVGEPFWKTPVFRADMRYLIFNPSWNVPPGILKKEALPSMKSDGGYLSRNGLQVIDRNGNVVDPSSIDWAGYSAGSFPYRLRQPPGVGNALGRVKFMFPNRHFVYLHDTPGKHLFDRSERAFSHGCIRLENPLDLAGVLLGWSPEQIESALSSGKTRTVNLSRPIPVFLLYLTAVAEGDEVLFRNDVYNRDAAVLNALDRSFPYKTIESCTF
ncbi:MAG: L,D-transpeptidase family protein [Prosthecochloris sp.]|uniref:L,D-transpeptidase family protein n=1 Tax=Prosthecochloris sp. TaxID=290513 RepID=UPI002587F990|nr:L,D-transpeptidase family protein [Prosthecochloris sp.]MCW8797420.1 L,D-transpeptidase family protein [Prosthecochloris sp.]